MIPTPIFTEQSKNPCPNSSRRACEAGQAQGCNHARVNWPTAAGSLLGPLPPCSAHRGHGPADAGEARLPSAAQGGGHQATAASPVVLW